MALSSGLLVDWAVIRGRLLRRESLAPKPRFRSVLDAGRAAAVSLLLLISVARPIDGRTLDFGERSEEAARSLSTSVSPARLLSFPRELTFELPDRFRYVAHRVRRERRALDDFSWSGELFLAGDPSGSVEGVAIFTSYRGHLTGWIGTRDGAFLFTAGDSSRPGLERLEAQNSSDACVEPDFTSADRLVRSSPVRLLAPGSNAGAGSPTIDLLVVHTPGTRTAAGSAGALRSRVQNAVDYVNQVFANSAVDARVRLAGLEELDYRASSVALEQDLAFLVTSPEVARLREGLEADQVALLKPRCEPTGCGAAIGMKRAYLGTAAAPVAHFVASLPAIPENLAHELAHNLGCGHEPTAADSPSVSSFPFAYAHFVPGEFRTLVESSQGACPGCPSIPHLSNPGVAWEGLPTGIAGARDNAEVVRRTAATVASFGRLAGRLSFAGGPTLEVDESDGHLELEVLRTDGSIGAVSVEVATVGGTAGEHDDYEALAERVSWKNGQAVVLAFPQTDDLRRPVRIPLVDDDVAEPDETFEVALRNITGDATLGNPSRLTVTVHDDDAGAGNASAPSVRFTEQSVEGDEGATLRLGVERFGDLSDAAVVSARTVAGTSQNAAVAGEDFLPLSTELSWSRNEGGARQLELILLQDTLLEGTEELGVELTWNGLTLATAEVAILDDDGGRTPCVPGEGVLCLSERRFRVEVDYQVSAEVQPSDGHVIPLDGGASGLVWFFDPDNVEMLVKVLDACALPGFESYWVFYAATSDRGFLVRVTDTETGRIRDYRNPLGMPALPVTDTSAFSCGLSEEE